MSNLPLNSFGSPWKRPFGTFIRAYMAPKFHLLRGFSSGSVCSSKTVETITVSLNISKGHFGAQSTLVDFVDLRVLVRNHFADDLELDWKPLSQDEVLGGRFEDRLDQDVFGLLECENSEAGLFGVLIGQNFIGRVVQAEDFDFFDLVRFNQKVFGFFQGLYRRFQFPG